MSIDGDLDQTHRLDSCEHQYKEKEEDYELAALEASTSLIRQDTAIACVPKAQRQI